MIAAITVAVVLVVGGALFLVAGGDDVQAAGLDRAHIATSISGDPLSGSSSFQSMRIDMAYGQVDGDPTSFEVIEVDGKRDPTGRTRSSTIGSSEHSERVRGHAAVRSMR